MMTDGRLAAGRSGVRGHRGRVGPLEILAVLVPLLTVAALALVRPIDEPSTPRIRPPTCR